MNKELLNEVDSDVRCAKAALQLTDPDLFIAISLLVSAINGIQQIKESESDEKTQK